MNEEAEAKSQDRIVTKYDPRKPNRLNRRQLASLSELFVRVAEDLTVELKSELRIEVQARIKELHQERFQAFVNALPDPACFYQVDCEPMKTPLFWVLDHTLVFSAVDRFLGGTGDVSIDPRQLTEVEEGISDHIVETVMGCIVRRFKRIEQLTAKQPFFIKNPQRVDSLDRKETVLVITFEVTGQASYGDMTIGFPLAALEKFIEKIVALDESSNLFQEDHEAWKAYFERKINQVEIGLPVVLGEAEISLGEIMGLQLDDVIIIGRKITEPVEMRVGSKSVIRGNVGTYNERLALKIVDIRMLDESA
jgi:flagellar motor switch protein FliM